VQMIANVAMIRGMLGRPGRGLLPLRGHSNVQGIGSMGVVPRLKDSVRQKMEQYFQIKLPASEGLDTLGAVERAEEGRIRFALCTGGNLFGSNPDAAFASRALRKVDLVVYLSTTLNTGHVCGRGRETIILPVLARDEESQGTTQESMFSYVRLSDGGEPRHDGPRSEVDIIATIARLVLGDSTPVDWESLHRHERIRAAIAATIPGYEAIGAIDQTKREFHIGGRIIHQPRFATDTGRAKFDVVSLPPLKGAANGSLRLMTVRSEGQFNTVVYEDEDIYRGQERRDVVMMNRDDIDRLGLKVDQRVIVRSEAGMLSQVLVREIDIRAGNAAMYYPEANVLIPRQADPRSRTPAFKSAVITIEPDPRAMDESPAPAREPQPAGAVPRRGLKAC
jgi:molybdopterin-dependent oxidoreductase alpha subunit